MDLIHLFGIAFALLVVILTIIWLRKKKMLQRSSVDLPEESTQIVTPANARAQVARTLRNRLEQRPAVRDTIAAVPAAANRQTVHHTSVAATDKMGAKKRAKLEAKEEKRQQRERELLEREERKAKEAELEKIRMLAEEEEAALERKKAEIERLAREEEERKEQEEYLKMKTAFSIEEEGFDEEESTKENLLGDFIQYIKDNKVVVLEELANEFKLKTQQVIDRIQELQANGGLTGVIDDRGKFIYISEEELLAVAKFIKQRGRISISELAENSNKLINLTPIAAANSA